MGYADYSAEVKIECVRRYFSEPPITMRELAEEMGVNRGSLFNWIKKARIAGMIAQGESLPAMVEVPMPPAPAEESPKPAAAPTTPQAVTITIGKATVTLPPSMLAEALEALLRQ